jgi:uncharacterized membrane protein
MLLAVNWPISFEQPVWLWLLLAIPVIVIVSQRSLAGLEPHRRIVAVLLRCAVVAVLAMALARAEYVRHNEHVAVMFVLDKSHSIPEDLRTKAQDFIHEVARDADRDDRVGVVSFDAQADVDLIPSRGGAKEFGFGIPSKPDSSNIMDGLRLALAALPDGFKRRVVLLTDGNENAGNAEEEVSAAVANKVALDVIPLKYTHEHEMLLDRIVVPSLASKDTRIPIRIIAKSRREARARITLYHNGQEIQMPEPEYELSGGMRPTVIRTSIEVFSGGVHRFDARLTPINPGDDEIVENNRVTGFTFVEEQGRVLLLAQTGAMADNLPLINALRREKLDIEASTVNSGDTSIDLLKLMEYSVVILANISADTFNDEQHKALASYVKDFGGGLIMIGGNDSLGAGGWIGKPVEEVSPVSFDVKQKKVMPRGALAIIMHSCESPQGNYYGMKAAIAAVETLSSRDYLGVITYNPFVGGANWDVPLSPAYDKEAIVRKIRNLAVGDMPDFATTMNIAVRDLLALKDVSQRHIIIISDGDPSPPSGSTISKMNDHQITCSTIGIGYGGAHCIEPTLRDIANKTEGKFYRCTNPNTLPQIFIKEAKVIRRPLIDEHRFTPQVATSIAQTLQGIAGGELPDLGGLVLTEPKADIMLPLVRKNADGRDDPLLAHWNYEMGKMTVFTSGLWKKWGADWAGWEKFGKFWAQVVRWTMRQAGSADFDVATRIEGNTGKVVIEALKKDASYLNFLQINGLLTLPNMESRPLQLIQTGPGQYEASFDLPDNGNYLINLKYTDPQHATGLIRTGLSIPYSPEYRELETNTPLLQRIVNRSGGRTLTMDPVKSNVFDPKGLPPSASKQPVWRWIVTWLLLPLFLLDVAGRRLASTLAMSIYVELAVFAVLFGVLYTAQASFSAYLGAMVLAELVGWAVRWRYIVPTIEFFTSSVTALARAGQRSDESLRQLKDVRDKVREDLDAKPPGPQELPTIPLEPAADPRKRFDVDEETAVKPAGDLSESLGGAVASEGSEESRPDRPKPGRKPADTGDLAARLLKAKRRARDQMDEDAKDS